MTTPDYYHGTHAWPIDFALPDGYSGVGIEDGLAYVHTPEGPLTTIPITAFYSGDSGFLFGLLELQLERGTVFTDTINLEFGIK